MPLSGFKRSAKAVEPRLPGLAIFGQPLIKLAERLRFQGIEPTLPVRPHRDKAGFVQDSQMPRHTGLVDPDLLDKVVDLAFTSTERVKHTAACRVGYGLKTIYMHVDVYAC